MGVSEAGLHHRHWRLVGVQHSPREQVRPHRFGKRRELDERGSGAAYH
jgi:hypothetical protein